MSGNAARYPGDGLEVSIEDLDCLIAKKIKLQVNGDRIELAGGSSRAARFQQIRAHNSRIIQRRGRTDLLDFAAEVDSRFDLKTAYGRLWDLIGGAYAPRAVR